MTRHTENEALGTTLEQRQEVYRALFLTQLDPETLTKLRAALNRELVTGGGRFKAEIEAALKRRVQPGQRGRPRKQTNTNSEGENQWTIFRGETLNDSDPIYLEVA